MSQAIAYTPEQVTKALIRLAESQGDAGQVADELLDDEYQVPADTLRYWMLESHREQYHRLVAERGTRLEEETVAELRETIRHVSSLKRDVIDRVKELSDNFPREAPNALRALTDAEAKGTTQLLQLTGRPVSGAREGGSDAMLKLAQHMIDAGLMRAADGITLDPADVEEVS